MVVDILQPQSVSCSQVLSSGQVNMSKSDVSHYQAYWNLLSINPKSQLNEDNPGTQKRGSSNHCLVFHVIGCQIVFHIVCQSFFTPVKRLSHSPTCDFLPLLLCKNMQKQFLKCINKFNKILPQIEWCMSSNVAEDGRGLIHGDALFLKVLPITVTSLRFQGTTHIHGGSPLLGKWFANICCQPVISPFIFFTWSFTKQTFKNFDKAQYIRFSICGSCFWYQIKEVFS